MYAGGNGLANGLIWNTRRTVEHQRNSRHLTSLLRKSDRQWLGLTLGNTVDDADRDREQVDTCFGDESLRLLYIGEVGLPIDTSTSLGNTSELGLDQDPEIMCDRDDPSRGANVLLERQPRAIEHH